MEPAKSWLVASLQTGAEKNMRFLLIDVWMQSNQFFSIFFGFVLNPISGGYRISPRWGRQPSEVRAKIPFYRIFPKTARNFKKNGPRGARPSRTPIRSANAHPQTCRNIYLKYTLTIL